MVIQINKYYKRSSESVSIESTEARKQTKFQLIVVFV